MAAVQGEVRFDKIAEKWHALAQRRLAYIGELARSGRWKWYYAEEQFKLQRRDAERAAALGRTRGSAFGDRHKRCSAGHLTLLPGMAIAVLALVTIPSPGAIAQSLKRGEELLTRSCGIVSRGRPQRREPE